MKTALIQLTHKKAIDFLREMEEAEMIRVLNISHFKDDKDLRNELAMHHGAGYLHEPNPEDDLSADFPAAFPKDDPGRQASPT